MTDTADPLYFMPSVGAQTGEFTHRHTENGPHLTLTMAQADPRACPMCTGIITKVTIEGADDIHYEVHWDAATSHSQYTLRMTAVRLDYTFWPCACQLPFYPNP